jgi:hypothetical protein
MNTNQSRAHKAAVEFLHKMARDLPELKNGNTYKLELVFDHVGGDMWRIQSAEFYTTPGNKKSSLILQQ